MMVDPPIRRFPVYHALAVALVFFSVVMSALVSRLVFERLPHLEDEVAYLFQAKTYARGQLVIDTPQPRRAYWQPFVIDLDGKRFGKYTPGWPLLLAPGVLAGQPWVINAFFAGLTVAVAYRLGRELFNPDTGLVAAALTAFSPMALLLNGTLMGHTTALFGVTLFLYAYWRLERGRAATRWGLLAGLALGLVVANRPLTGVAVAIPFAVWSLVRLARALPTGARELVARLRPLVALGAVALLLSGLIPLYNYAATGDPSANLYTYVWNYDRVGFGECCGRSAERGEGGHNLERGVRHMRFDLSLMAADLYGWQIGTFTPAVIEHFQTEGDYYPLTGLSWLLLPFGLLVAFRRVSFWIALWLLLGYAWLVFAFTFDDARLTRDPLFSWIWLAVAFVWLVLPLVVLWRAPDGTRKTWAWLLVSLALGLIGVQLAYWIGSQRYSTRYYFEALTALSLLSALPVAYLARQGLRFGVYAALAIALVWSLVTYSVPRINVLRGFNNIHRDVLDAVEARREGDRPVLVLVTGETARWRALGSLMAVTSPYLDGDIVGAWDYGGAGVREEILARFPDRQVIEMLAVENDAWFEDENAVG